MSELISLLEQWSRLEPDRCRQDVIDGVFEVFGDDGFATTWHPKALGGEMRIEQACREAIHARDLVIHSIETPIDNVYTYWVAMGRCTGGLKKRSVEALLSSYLLYLQSTLAPDREEEPCKTYTIS